MPVLPSQQHSCGIVLRRVRDAAPQGRDGFTLAGWVYNWTRHGGRSCQANRPANRIANRIANKPCSADRQ